MSRTVLYANWLKIYYCCVKREGKGMPAWLNTVRTGGLSLFHPKIQTLFARFNTTLHVYFYRV
jgi:hypothetical protein